MLKSLSLALPLIAVLAYGQGAIAAQTLTSQDVDAAVRLGSAKKFRLPAATCTARGGQGILYKSRKRAHEVAVFSTHGRIAQLAASATRKYETFTAANVPEDMRAMQVFITAEPIDDIDMTMLPADVVKIVVKSPSGAIIQPTGMDTESIAIQNLAGAKFERNRVAARFDAATLAGLDGDAEIAVVTTDAEQRCTIRRQDIIRIANGEALR